MTGNVMHVSQGEHAVSDQPDAMITTILGSCVATCLWDPVSGLGGMNHILLPDGRAGDLQMRSHGTNAMELLINALLRRGAARERLRAKLFGGARMIAGLSDIGQANADFVQAFCHREGIACMASSLGGNQGRRIQFWPASGKARQQFLRNTPEVIEAPKPSGAMVEASDVELF